MTGGETQFCTEKSCVATVVVGAGAVELADSAPEVVGAAVPPQAVKTAMAAMRAVRIETIMRTSRQLASQS